MATEPLVKRALRRCVRAGVRAARQVLPAAMFRWLFARALPPYQTLVRSLYYCQGLLLFSWWQPARWHMIREVHRILPYTLVGIGGLHVTYRLAEQLLRTTTRGDFVELGVARGGCAALLGQVLFRDDEAGSGRRLHLFDSFQGLPEPTADDFIDGSTGDHLRPLGVGSCLGTLAEVKQLLLEQHGFSPARVVFHEGWFNETVPAANTITAIALLRIDGDWYESTKVCLHGLYDRVVPGGAVIIDDYQSCYGCKRAVDEFITERQLTVELVLDGRGGGYFCKP